MGDIDLTDVGLHADGDRVHEVFHHLREHEPLHWNAAHTEPGFWSVTRYDDCVRVQKDPASFSSSPTNVLGPHRVHGDQGDGKMLNTTDAPRHDELRRLVNRQFTPRAVARLEPYLRTVAGRALERALEAGECDFAAVAATLPVAGICALLGVPTKDWNLLLRLTRTAFGSFDGEYQCTGDVRGSAAQAHGRLLVYCGALLEERRRCPLDDLVSVLAGATDRGDLTNEEALLFFDLLVLGGNETTRHGTVGGVLELGRRPDQWRLLAGDGGLVPRAVEEILRWTSPSRHVIRRASRDVELHGRTIRAGDDVALWHASANRDPRAFPDASRFAVDRTPNRHLAFGSGPHFCLGTALAALEIRVMLEELLARVARVDVLAPPDRLRSTVIGGIKHLRVRLHAR